MINQKIIKIDNILPQTQCTRCNYPSCLDYAKALANDEADINQCPPGGNDVITKLAKLLDKPIKELNPNNGKLISQPTVAIINEDECIGCTLCIKACPVDAILGTNKMMHTVIEDYCTGCDLCLPACPVDCITMVDSKDINWSKEKSNEARKRFNLRNSRKLHQFKLRENNLKKQGNCI